MENKSSALSKQEIERYCRQIVLPEIGLEGQERISKSKVLVVGAGGLGSPCLMYLAGAGVGEIGIIDGDLVDTSNLHRQIIHVTENKGIHKSKSAELFIKAFNPMVKVYTYEENLTNKNALKICKDYDLLIDCCDNPSTRYLTNDICVLLNKPLVSGSAVKWEGQLTIYVQDKIKDTPNDKICKLPCYRCLFPIPSPPSAVCSCSEVGVFGPTPGVIGTLQANEAIKIIIGASDKILAKRMLMYDGYDMSFKIFKLRNNKSDCIICGDIEKITISLDNFEGLDYDEFVNPKVTRVEKRVQIPEENNLKWTVFLENIKEKNLNDICMLDVRSEEQFNMFNINLESTIRFINIPLKNLKENFDELNKKIFSGKKEIYITCRAGNLSTHATKLLIENGYNKTYNLENGIHGYIKEIDSINTPYY
jgi:adenylyltransferase/sulfurtransferase